jgi:hypothetical protein
MEFDEWFARPAQMGLRMPMYLDKEKYPISPNMTPADFKTILRIAAKAFRQEDL